MIIFKIKRDSKRNTLEVKVEIVTVVEVDSTQISQKINKTYGCNRFT